VHWKKVTLVGVGLLGGSLGLALKRRGLAGAVAGFVRRPASIKECQRAGAVDTATLDLAPAVEGADLVVLCTPIAQMRGLAEQMLPFLARGAQAGAHFVGSHPMAGSEKAGVTAAQAGLFEEAICVVTPAAGTNRGAVRKVNRLWNSVGGRVLRLTPEAHDQLVSRSSHLPHVVAAQLSNLVLSPHSPKDQAMLCANGFRDTTRIASGSPEMWRDIALANRKNLLSALEEFTQELSGFKRVLKIGDEAAIARFFQQAKQRRDQWSNRARSTSPE
jgi:prephenate dehydrogenase